MGLNPTRILHWQAWAVASVRRRRLALRMLRIRLDDWTWRTTAERDDLGHYGTAGTHPAKLAGLVTQIDRIETVGWWHRLERRVIYS